MSKHKEPEKAEFTRGRFLAGGAAASIAAVAGPSLIGAEKAFAKPPAGPPTSKAMDPTSRFFSTTFVEYSDSLDTESDGDLWPCAWADDGEMYVPNGDGRGFSEQPFSDIVMNKVSGAPETGIVGERLAAGDEIAKIWGDPSKYNRKPTGIVAVDGDGDGRDELYMAVQDLRYGPGAFDDAPNASISKSVDHGRTWQKTEEAMFTDYFFTTIFFLDFGQSNELASVLGDDGTDYVYAYGLDNNWRDSFSGTVEDPQSLYLARVPKASIQERDTWEFFAGKRGKRPVWNTDADRRKPVLTDTRRVYTNLRGEGAKDTSVISQGSVVYNAPLERYIYTSWTEYTFEFYEAPDPWGPWTLFYRKDFGGYPWFGRPADPGCPGPKNGGYATVVPSKFISDDGRSMWVQANWFVGVACGAPNYNFSLRKFEVAPYEKTKPENEPNPDDNLAETGEGVVPIEKSAHYGNGAYYNDGAADHSEDSFDGEDKDVDFWGYLFEREYNLDRVVYTTGNIFPDGGWFESDLRVQVRRDFKWRDVKKLSMSPEYPYDETAGPNKAYTLSFNDARGDGVRIIGVPGGDVTFTSIAELEVYFDGRGNGPRGRGRDTESG